MSEEQRPTDGHSPITPQLEKDLEVVRKIIYQETGVVPDQVLKLTGGDINHVFHCRSKNNQWVIQPWKNIHRVAQENIKNLKKISDSS